METLIDSLIFHIFPRVAGRSGRACGHRAADVFGLWPETSGPGSIPTWADVSPKKDQKPEFFRCVWWSLVVQSEFVYCFFFWVSQHLEETQSCPQYVFDLFPWTLLFGGWIRSSPFEANRQTHWFRWNIETWDASNLKRVFDLQCSFIGRLFVYLFFCFMMFQGFISRPVLPPWRL